MLPGTQTQNFSHGDGSKCNYVHNNSEESSTIFNGVYSLEHVHMTVLSDSVCMYLGGGGARDRVTLTY